ncbi:MAG: hypothetical protein OXK82_03610 [Deltaproteobacteria bacterium]|nr:hypothetical protein [Deltaproteobacteria bacterium]
MKITAVDIHPLRVPLKGLFRNAHDVKTHQDSIVVRVCTDEGPVGLGNVDPDPGHSAESFAETLKAVRMLAPGLVGRDPLNISAALDLMDRALPCHLDAKAVLEMALFDLKGKALDQPVHSLLGGRLRDGLRLNGWIGMLEPDEAAREAAGWRDAGFRSVKIKLGSGVESDRDRVAAVRGTVGPAMQLRVDANEAYGVDEAIRLGKALAPMDVALLEQPVARSDYAGLARVRRAVDMPVMADEAIIGPETLVEVIRKEAADIVKVKVMKQGGITRTVRMVNMAEAAGIRCVIGHGFGLTINTLAELHVAASCANVMEGCESVGPLKMGGDVVTRPIDESGGWVAVPDAPGLGAELDPSGLERWSVSAP